jgi:hypothetical protein
MSHVANGGYWTLRGEHEFAAFLWEKGGEALTAAYVPKEVEAKVGEAKKPLHVIVSRYDEEKIWRRLRRQDSAAASVALRLYG